MAMLAAPCLNDEAVGTAASHDGLFENEVSAMFTPHGTWNNNDKADAIYYFSSGKYALENIEGCPARHAGQVVH